MAADGAGGVTATCHCGAVSIALADIPKQVTRCNCTLCHSTGALWTYPDADRITVPDDAALTDSYAWNGKHVDFHRCATCGCVTHWVPRDPSRQGRGVNARLLPPEVLAAATVEYRDGAGTGLFADCPPDEPTASTTA